MKLPLMLVALLFVLGGLLQAQTAAPVPESVPRPTPEEIVAERQRLMQEVLAAIAGRENEPAENVFKNIQKFKGMPAGRIPRLMNMGFGRALGVSCSHCHTPGEWDKDDKPEKRVARDMIDLANRINQEQLPLIKNLDSAKPMVNCTTCHRGEVKPATDLARR